ncbi:hypothetical protein SAMN05216360_12540 [Methylobacterium phyllostachyos]|uniref:Uncharacterized protein n=1 Tax=Methylobacterium phyllostachyos TaxID=582672 RepID=A0A1H0K871_9HYPH|nr:hypothetical protein [Methylobacterium phyllostachyos]SDO52165.1 hypothetical protein SAMN05216360_12540 [Methylobacterium phyllostachyos]
MIRPADAFGPWAANITPSERTARLRAMQAIARLSCGPRSDTLCALLRLAETDPDTLEAAAAALARLEPLDYRRVLASYAQVHRPGLSVRSGPRRRTH